MRGEGGNGRESGRRDERNPVRASARGKGARFAAETNFRGRERRRRARLREGEGAGEKTGCGPSDADRAMRRGVGGWAPSDGDPAVGLGGAGERREAGWVGPNGPEARWEERWAGRFRPKDDLGF